MYLFTSPTDTVIDNYWLIREEHMAKTALSASAHMTPPAGFPGEMQVSRRYQEGT